MLRSLFLFAALLFAASNSTAQWLPQSSIVITYPKAGDAVMSSPFYTDVYVKAEGEFYYPVVYEYTTNGGTTWELIKREKYQGKAYIGSFQWDVPNINAPQAQLRITDSLGTVGLSEIFRIREIPKLLTAKVNNNRFPLPVNYDVVIEWSATGELSPIDIEYTVAGFARYKIVYELDSTRRSFVWHTPADPVGEVKLSVAAQNGGMVIVGPFEINFTNDVKQSNDESTALAVFPNPASSSLKVHRGSYEPSAQLALTDITGRIALQRTLGLGASDLDIDVSSVLPGNYMLTLRTADGTRSRMITIAR